MMEKPRLSFGIDDESEVDVDDEDDDEDAPEIEDDYNKPDEDDDYDEDKLTEESYRTTFDENPEDLSLDAAEMADDDDY